MLLKFFSQVKRNDEPGGLDYVMNNKTARILRGSVEITRAVINASPPNLVQRFTSGVVNDDSELSPDKDEQLLDELELQLLGGRPKESMPWCVVEHRDKGKREKHFVIPIYDLVFEKPVHPYIDRIDQKGFEAWVEHFNLRHGIAPPGHRLRVDPDFEHLKSRVNKSDIEFLRLVWERVKLWVKNKNVKNRIELEARLITEGYRVRCNTHAGKPLAQPHILGPRGKWLRLKGSTYYRPEFGISDVKPLDLADEKAVKERLLELREIMFDRFDFRAYHLIGRLYGKKEQERVTLGRARQHFEKLIEQKMSTTPREALTGQRVDYGYLAQVLSIHNFGLEPANSSPMSAEVVSTSVPPSTVKFKLIPAAKAEATVSASEAPTMKVAGKTSAPEAELSESVPAEPSHKENQIPNTLVQNSSPIETDRRLAETQAPESVAPPILSAEDSTNSEDDQTKPHAPPVSGRGQAVGEHMQENPVTEKPVPAKKRRKLKKCKNNPQKGPDIS